MLSKKILVIDDEPEIAKVISDRLVASGYEVATAKDGKEGLSQIVIFDPDLIILDTLMPVMNGLQFMQKYEESEKMRKIPVIAISAREGVRDFFTDLLVRDFMVKPLDMPVLLATIGKLLGQPVTAAAASAKASKRLLLVGVDKFVQHKIEEFFKSAGWEVALAKNDGEAYHTALTFLPDAILCQYWDKAWEGSELDTKLLSKRLSEEHSLERIQFTVYCPTGPILDAMRSFPESRLIRYNESSDLMTEIAKRFGIPNR